MRRVLAFTLSTALAAALVPSIASAATAAKHYAVTASAVDCTNPSKTATVSFDVDVSVSGAYSSKNLVYTIDGRSGTFAGGMTYVSADAFWGGSSGTAIVGRFVPPLGAAGASAILDGLSDPVSGSVTPCAPGVAYPVSATVVQPAVIANCRAELTGERRIRINWDSLNEATSYQVTASPSAAVNVGGAVNGVRTAVAENLAPQTAYTFTVEGQGPRLPAGATCTTAPVTTLSGPPTITSGPTYGRIDASRQQRVSFTMTDPPPGSEALWFVGDDITNPVGRGTSLSFDQPCGRLAYVRAGHRDTASGITVLTAVGAATATPPCRVPRPALVSGSLSGSSLTAEYQLNGAPDGTSFVYETRIQGGAWIPGGTLANAPTTGQFSTTVAGLRVPHGAEIRAKAVNGPIESAPWAVLPVQGSIPGFIYPLRTGTTGTALTVAPVFNPINADIPANGVTFSLLAPLPRGLSLNASTGAVSGTPQDPFVGSVAVLLTMPDGRTSQSAVPIRLSIAPQAPGLTATVAYPRITALQGTTLPTAKPAVGGGVPTPRFFSSPDLCSTFPGLDIDPATGGISGRTTSVKSRVDVTVVVSSARPASPCGAASGTVITRTTASIAVGANPNYSALSLAYLGSQHATVHTHVGTALSIAATVYPPSQSGITYRVTSGVLPPGLTLDRATGTIAGTATAVTAGSDVTVTASQSAAASPTGTAQSASAVITIDVAAAPTTPGVGYTSPVTVSVGQSYLGLPVGAVKGQTFTLSAGPTGLTVDASTGAISWTPSAKQVGSHNVSITETSSGALPTVVTVAITVTPAGGSAAVSGGSTAGAGIQEAGTAAVAPCRAPNGTMFADMSGSVGSSFAMTPNGYGFTDPASFRVTDGALPDGILLDTTLGLISGTPTRGNRGVGPLTITETWADGTVRSDRVNFSVVDPHQSVNYPSLVIGATGLRAHVSPVATGSGTTHRYAIVCGQVPAGMTFNPRSGVFSGRPLEPAGNPVPLRVRYTDSYHRAEASLVIPVISWNVPLLEYPNNAHLGWHRSSRIASTRIALPAGTRYRVARGRLPAGLRLNAATGVVYGKPLRLSARPTELVVAAVGKKRKTVAYGALHITVQRAVVPLAVTARPSVQQIPATGPTTLVLGTKHAKWALVRAGVKCVGCTYSFTASTGKLVVRPGPRTTAVKVTITSSGRTAEGRKFTRAATWIRTWRVAR